MGNQNPVPQQEGTVSTELKKRTGIVGIAGIALAMFNVRSHVGSVAKLRK
jgi:hypothetical protein